MRKATTEELRTIQIEILDVVAKFCDENQICYWIDSGTLLGSVRHKGYIPWDDDIDIGMLRPDYIRFTELFNKVFADTKYQFKCAEKDLDYHLPFGKVIDTSTVFVQNGHRFGINIDVFVFDNAPDDDVLVEKLYDRRDFWKNLDAIQTATTPPRGNVIRKCAVNLLRRILKLFPKNYFVRKTAQNAITYNHRETKRVGNFTGRSRSAPCDKSVFSSFILGEFEGKYYKIPVGYKQWLQCFYGTNYMQLPPEDKREHHDFEAYILD